ncbi:unnamed protein product [Durusdinium trenchii]
MIAFDVTVAVEGVTFEVWSDSEVMCAQAQSTVLSVFTLSYAIAATLGGVLYDAASWRGCATYHVACLALQVLSLAIQPAVHKSFREFLGGAAAKSVDGTDDAVRPFSGATAIVPAADGCQSPESERACSFALPGAVEGGSPRQSEADDADVVDPTPLRGANELEATPQRGRAGSAHTAGDSPEPNVRRSGGSHASSRRPTLRSRLTTRTAHTHHTTESGRTAHTARSGRSNMTRQTAQTSGTLATAMTGLSRLTRLSEAGQAFDFHYGVTNALRPNIASNTVRVSLDGVADEYGKQKSGEGEEEPQVAAKQGGGKLPRDLFLPAFVIMLSSFNNNASYGVEWSTFAIFFKEQHGWESATWAGICQTAGDLLAALIMAVAGKPTRTDLGELSGIRWFWHSLTGQPYNVSCFLLAWVLLNFGMCIPWLPAAIASQIIMGTIYVFAVKASTDMNLFYSLGDSQVFLAMQVLCRNADSLGCVLAGFVAFSLYELEPLGPFLLTGSISVFALVVYTTSMCYRVGFGTDIETAEAQRSRRKGLRRVSTWKSHRSVVNTELEDETA